MSVKSTYQAQQVLGAFSGTPAAVAAFTPYAALMTTAPNPDGTGGVEVAGGGYARQACGFGAPAAVSNASGGGAQVTNAAVISYGTASANWGSVSAVCIYDAATAGTLRYIIPLAAAMTISSGNGPVTIAAGALVLTET